MTLINQISAIRSLNDALVPGSTLVDGRTEQDRLAFLSDFASLINFYDKDNSIYGNWKPFLLKDPVFLLASISKTDFSKYHSLYQNSCITLARILKENNTLTMELADNVNLLFDQLMNIFIKIERWTYYMQTFTEEYNLKTYVLYQVKTNFSVYLWALISLRETLFLAYAALGMEPVQYYMFDAFDKITWKQNKDKSPYWEVLGLAYPFKNKENTAESIFNAIKKAGDELFNFFQKIIRESAAEFEKVKAIKSKYPDTTLLRTFINLLSIQQGQLNGISQKHLQFYYKEILKQAALPAVADNTNIFAELAKTDATFMLPAGTIFNAGIDLQKNPILFSSAQDVNLNPAVITEAYTINKSQVTKTGGFTSLYLNSISNPGILNKDTDGKIKYWEAFGSSTASSNPNVKQGIAFASPMLLLREGKRSIKFYLTYTGDISLEMLQDASYYLSTQNSWLYIEKQSVQISDINSSGSTPLKENIVVINITLEPTDPPIESFITNPDGLDSKWPMVKIQFVSFVNLPSPPVLTSLKIEVAVSDIKTFQFYNDSGALSSKTPYQAFGPMPLVNSSFIIGNNEIFSKPLESLYIELDWDKLPELGFSDYYKQYNCYVNGGLNIPVTKTEDEQKPEEKKTEEKKPVATRLLSFLKRPKDEPVTTTTNTTGNTTTQTAADTPVECNYDQPFNNLCFTVDFNLLQDSTWKDFYLSKLASININKENKMSGVAYPDDKCDPPSNSRLFSVDDTTLVQESYFSYPPIIITKPANNSALIANPKSADPAIQNGPFSFTDSSTSGFMRMVLTGPSLYGFGSEIYPKVVAETAFYNSWVIYKMIGPQTKDAPCLAPPANLPFAPKAVNFIADYTASQTYNLTSVSGTYPIQCYLYDPFSNYKVYDNSNIATDNSSYTLNSSAKATCSITLFPVISCDSYLFLQMENLVPASSMNLYFELTRKSEAGLQAKPAKYYYFYLSKTGWKELSVLSDGTNEFDCSGILNVVVPDDISMENPQMPVKKYWFYIGLKGDEVQPAKMTLLKTNGFNVQRTGASFLTDPEIPKLDSNIITKTQNAIPQISAIIQPFASTGGRAAENQLTMNRRVSTRLKTKDRAVSADDYFRIIKQEYNDIYYSAVVFDNASKNTVVYVVKTYESWTEVNAFAPQVSACSIDEIQLFLQDRASDFADIIVSNFNLFPVNVTADILIKPEFIWNQQQITENIKQAVNIFLSPWINSDSQQITINEELTDAQLVKFIQSIEGVAMVQNVSYSPVYTEDDITNGRLLITGMEHVITVKNSK